MKHSRTLGILIVAASLAGCLAITPNIAVNKKVWQERGSVGIAVASIPMASAHKLGNQGLLDIAINNSAAGGLEQHLSKQDVSQINEVAEKLSKYISAKGLTIKKIEKPIDISKLPESTKENDAAKKIYYASRDFTGLKSSLGVDKLLVISVNQIGTMRSYYGFIPTSEPSGYAAISGYLVNLSNNQLEWNQAVSQSVPLSNGNWDTPPDYKGLTSAMYAAYAQARQLLINNFIE